ncbi:MAG: aminoacyl-tRNA deacylase [Burkholderiaceae bacterium]|nr:aminoacyl-tRNA deacylase [Burkholderiaceae bacterium]
MAARKPHVSQTPAMLFLQRRGVAFEVHPFRYVDHGGAGESARQLGVSEHLVVKTLVMQDEASRPLIVLMHGDRSVSTRDLARQIGAKSIEPCKPEVAERHSGYQVGGTSPFATRKSMPVYVERSVLALESVYVSAGRRGCLLSIAPAVFVSLLGAEPVNCAGTS